AEGIVTIHLRRGSVPDALAFIEPLARRYATNLHLQALYAEVLVRAERYEPAWNAARAALRCNERFVPALKALVRASLAQGRRRLADTILEQAIEIDGDDPELHYIQGTLYRESAERLRDALDEFEAAVRLRPDYVDARMALGVQLLSGGRYEDALGHFQVVVRLMPGSAAAHLNVGDAQRSLRQWDPAKASFERVLRLDPNNAPAHFNLGLMHYAIGLEREQQEQIDAMQLARQHFVQYRNLMGPRLARDDPSEQYLSEVDRTIQRAQRAIERAARRAAQQAAREAAAAEAGGADGAAGDGGEGG
ncbi:MAG: tetratricopeptide repeat protein, partial [Myxococcales bacterium]|nr:tetratricopeptide repeat protein [Myxococcales bacterium]